MGFSNKLIYWYLKNKRDLPWRKDGNAYRVWLSEIILQQTKISQGTDYYLRFCEVFPTVFDLAGSTEDAVLKLWQGLGYYSRARNLHFTARYIVKNYQGKIPDNYKELVKLKGVGDYTASAIASICFNEPKAVVDGNVFRVLSRYFNISIPINTPKGKEHFKQIAQKMLDKDDPGTYNQAIMELGAMVCKPKNTDCIKCPVQKGCKAYMYNNIFSFPVKERKNKIRKRFFNFLVLDINGTGTMLEKRRKKDIWQNLYQFPLLETVGDAEVFEVSSSKIFIDLVRENDFQLKLYNNNPILHKLTHQNIFMKFWIISIQADIEEVVGWEKVTNFAVPTPIHNFIENFRK